MISWNLRDKYILGSEPPGSNLCRRIEYEWLSDSTQKLPKNHVVKRVVGKTPDTRSDSCKDRPSYDALLDSLDVQYPVGWKVEENVTDEVTHGNESNDD